MTSEISIISKLIHKQHRSLLECSTTNDKLHQCLLSPIIENSTDMLLAIPIPIHKICLDASGKKNVFTTDNLTIDELNLMLNQYMKNLCNIQNYLNKLDEHFKDLSKIIEYLRNNKSFTNTVELIETRLLQMYVKRNQINDLLNQFSIKHLMEKISPLILKSKSVINYNELLISTQLSINQKTTLIDHLKNEYRYTKYHLNEYSLKLKDRRESLMKLTKQIQQFLIQQSRAAKEANFISINNQHDRQHIELTNLSNEYEQLQNENYLLALKAKENLERFSMMMQSNHG
ncbi:unnamed protein product [Rotaria socialis]|uniref:Uncharacterized protein n=1 Tax=Rotaria socialis TaxID=392032 RepID=A0A818QBL1_9BILA|nr:unnamed protein product [Rotaria socialis]CAF4475979.1 unnamed protein product [Rotaria socialis]